MILSIIIPVYNRAWCIERALDSAYQFLSKIGSGEIIVIDDGSHDGSLDKIQKFEKNLADKKIPLKTIALKKNHGVAFARNNGARLASGEWLIFFDSDDLLISSSVLGVIETLEKWGKYPLHFFRCVNEIGQLVGEKLPNPISVNVNDFVIRGTRGESIPVVKRTEFLEARFDEDINGFEGLCHTRLVRRSGLAWVHPLVVRQYHTAHEDRLSSRSGVLKRSRSLARGYRRLLSEHWRVLSFRAIWHILIRWVYHGLRSQMSGAR
jgi:glycosyltransferase involved in cell wall biosynthesis